MKRIILALLTLIICLTLTSALGENLPIENQYDARVQSAIEALKLEWVEKYAQYIDADVHLEIKNTRIVFIKDDAHEVHEMFENVDYIVEFVLFSDLFGNPQYFFQWTTNDTVVFLKDGSAEVAHTNYLRIYVSRVFSYDFSGIIDSVEDLGAVYNQVFLLK